MGKRNIYEDISIGKLPQGAIFNQAVSEDYKEAEVFGVIITPRCDIENKKVTTFHYLPIVKMNDWLLKDYWRILKNQIIKNIHQSINQILAQNKFSKNLVGVFSNEEIIDKFYSKVNKKNQHKFKHLLNWLIKIEDIKDNVSMEFLDEINQEKAFKKLGLIILKDMVRNNRREFYLIEDWNETGNYYVILLREIQKLRWDFGVKIAKGINNDVLSKEHFMLNDIKDCKAGFIYPIKAIKSPYIEHLIQKFFTNFGRIGISDHIANLEEKLISKI